MTHGNACAERWVRSIKEECLAKLILFGERWLQRVVSNYLEHYHQDAITKARTISGCFRPVWGRQVREARSVVGSGSAAYSNITAAPHEHFYHTGTAASPIPPGAAWLVTMSLKIGTPPLMNLPANANVAYKFPAG